jgi:hypothetical protein
VEYRPYSKLYELHHCACFSIPYPYEEDLAKYGIDASKLSEADYTRAIGQLKSEIRKTVAEFRTAYAQNRLTMTVM